MKYAILSAFIFLAAFAFAANDWKSADATFRVTINTPARPGQSFFIPMPKNESGDMFSCAAFAQDGATVQVWPLKLGESTLGYGVIFPQVQNPPKGSKIQLYFSKGTTDGTAPEGANLTRVTRSLVTVTTRAFTAKEIIHFFGNANSRGRLQLAYVKTPGDIPADEKWQMPNKLHMAALLQWETVFVQQEDIQASFGANLQNVAWTVLIDGEPVADWHTSIPEKDGHFSPEVQLSKGLHTFQMLAIMRFGEHIPRPLMKANGAIKPVIGNAAPEFPQDINIETRDAEKAPAHISRGPANAFAASATSHPWQNSVAIAKCVCENAEFTDTDGKSITMQNDFLCWRNTFLPGVRAFGIEFSARRRFSLARHVHIRPKITGLPNVLPFTSPLEIKVTIDAPAEAAPLLKLANIRLSYSDHDKFLKSSQHPQPLDGKLSYTISSLPMTYFQDNENNYLPSTITVDICYEDSFSLSEYAPVRLVHPNKASEYKLTSSGTTLYVDNLPAVLVCSRLASTPQKTQTIQSKDNPKCVVLDAFTDNAFAPSAQLSLQQCLDKQAKGNMSFVCTTADTIAGTNRNTAMLATLPKLLEDNADIAFIVCGQSSAQDFETPLDTTSALLFISQACQARGTLPVLAVMPPFPNTNQERSRLDALFSKEMALYAGVHVMDFYSALPRDTAAKWYTTGLASLSVPNDHAREWLAKQIAIETEKLSKSDK